MLAPVSTIKLTLCMIVRDEEACLGRCLKSVASLVDEIIILDTGSRDSTIQIAETFGAKVFKAEWQEDFGLARNQALEKSSGEWILMMDADEILGYTSREELEALLENDDAEGYFIKIINILGHPPSSEISEDWVVRLFRNKPEYKFEGRIHEQVRPAISSSTGDSGIKIANLVIYHDGYLSEIIEQKQKVKRNSAIIEKALMGTPGNPFLFYSLGCERFLTEDYQGALAIFQKALINIPENEGYLGDLMIKTGLCLYMLDKKEEFTALFNSYKEKSCGPELLFLSGLSNLDQGHLTEAEDDIKRCLAALPDNPLKHFLLKEHQLYQTLGEIYEKKHRWKDAAEMYFMSVKTKPVYLYPIQKIIELYRYSELENVEHYLDFCSPENKYALLEKLHWQQNPDAVGFIILGLLKDLHKYMSTKEVTFAHLLSLRMASLVNRRISDCTHLLQLSVLLSQVNAFLALFPCAHQEVGSSRTHCHLLYQQIKAILLWKEPEP